MKRFLALVLSGMLGCAGCTGRGTPDGSPAKAELHLLIWADYLDQQLVAKFESETHSIVIVDNFDSGEALRAKIEHAPSGFDVVVPSDEILPALIADGKLEKLDPAKLPNLRNIAAGFKGMAFDPNNEFSVPFHWGTTGIAYDVKKVKTPPTSWADLFDPKVAANGTLLDDPREVFAAALRLDGATLDAVTSAQIDSAKRRIAAAKPKAWESQPQKLLIQGDVAIAQIYSGDAAQAAAEREGIAFVIPQEGGTLWFDNLAVAKGSIQIELAHRFIDFLKRPDISGANTNFKKYPSPNEAAMPHIDKAILSNPMIYPPEADLKRTRTLGEMNPDAKSLLLRAWAEIKAAQ
jgi:spermidine/putrescine transport system substrate-binding protein